MMRAFEGKIIFIDNEKIYKDALKKGKFDDYFVDQFAGDFGHCTDKGYTLMAGHMADSILAIDAKAEVQKQ
jgi:hypothetical protein